MLGDDDDDLSEDLRGLPLERTTGVDGVRGSEDESFEELLEDAKVQMGEARWRGDEGDEVGKGTAEGATRGGISMRGGGSTAGENLPELMERRRELRGVYEAG